MKHGSAASQYAMSFYLAFQLSRRLTFQKKKRLFVVRADLSLWRTLIARVKKDSWIAVFWRRGFVLYAKGILLELGFPFRLKKSVFEQKIIV